MTASATAPPLFSCAAKPKAASRMASASALSVSVQSRVWTSPAAFSEAADLDEDLRLRAAESPHERVRVAPVLLREGRELDLHGDARALRVRRTAAEDDAVGELGVKRHRLSEERARAEEAGHAARTHGSVAIIRA